MNVSIIIPIYNVSQYIERCLVSAFNQTYTDIEYILVNDATPDDSMSVVAKILENYASRKNIKVIEHAQNKGLSAARNTGIRESKGTYVFFLDSDDELPLNSIETLVQATKDNDPDLIIGDIEVIGADKNQYPQLTLDDHFYCENDAIMHLFLTRKWYEMAWNKLVKRAIFTEDDCWFREEILHEDNLWSFMLATKVRSMLAIKKKTYIYHIQNQSITRKKNKRNMESLYIVLSEMIQLAQKEKLFEKQKELIHYFDNLRIYYIKTLINNHFEKEYINLQKEKIDRLFDSSVRNHGRYSAINLFKNTVLTLWLQLK